MGSLLHGKEVLRIPKVTAIAPSSSPKLPGNRQMSTSKTFLGRTLPTPETNQFSFQEALWDRSAVPGGALERYLWHCTVAQICPSVAFACPVVLQCHKARCNIIATFVPLKNGIFFVGRRTFGKEGCSYVRRPD